MATDAPAATAWIPDTAIYEAHAAAFGLKADLLHLSAWHHCRAQRDKLLAALDPDGDSELIDRGLLDFRPFSDSQKLPKELAGILSRLWKASLRLANDDDASQRKAIKAIDAFCEWIDESTKQIAPITTGRWDSRQAKRRRARMAEAASKPGNCETTSREISPVAEVVHLNRGRGGARRSGSKYVNLLKVSDELLAATPGIGDAAIANAYRKRYPHELEKLALPDISATVERLRQARKDRGRAVKSGQCNGNPK